MHSHPGGYQLLSCIAVKNIVDYSHPGALLCQPHLTLLVSLHLGNIEISLVNMVNIVNMEISLDTW